MYRGKYQKFKKGKSVILIVSLVLLLIAAVGGTAAYLKDKSDSVTNTFTPAEVKITIEETKTETTKSDIYFTNSKTEKAVPVYIRATLVIYWTDTIDGKSVTIPQPTGASVNVGDLKNNGWFQVGDLYYYSDPVAPGSKTEVMLEPIKVTVPDGSTAQCHIDVRAEAIQAEPASVVETVWDDVKVDAEGKLGKNIEGGES